MSEETKETVEIGEYYEQEQKPLFRVWSRNRKRYLTAAEIQNYMAWTDQLYTTICRSKQLIVERFAGYYASNDGRPLFVGDIVMDSLGRHYRIINGSRGPNIRIQRIGKPHTVDVAFIQILEIDRYVANIHDNDHTTHGEKDEAILR